MKTIITCLAIALGSFAFGQNRMIGTTFNPSLGGETYTRILGQKLEYGIEYRTGWNVHYGAGYFLRRTRAGYEGSYYRSQGFLVSFSLMKRLMTSRSLVSPMGGIELGTVVYNTETKSTYGNPSTYWNQPMPDDAFEKLRGFAKAKFQLDFNFPSVILRVGPTFTVFETRVNGISRLESDIMNSAGVDIGLFIPLDHRASYQGIHLPARGTM